MNENIEITGVQDGALAYVLRGGSGCGLVPEATFGNDRVRPAPDGGLLIEKIDGSGCGKVFPEDVSEYLRAVQTRAMEQIPQKCTDGTAEFQKLLSTARAVNPDALDEDCSSVV